MHENAAVGHKLIAIPCRIQLSPFDTAANTDGLALKNCYELRTARAVRHLEMWGPLSFTFNGH